MVPAVLHRVCHGTPYPGQASPLSFTHAILHKHSRHKVRFCDYPAVIPSSHHHSSSSSSSVRGTYVRGLTDEDIWRLDVYEGDEYERKVVKIRTLAQVGDDAGIGNVEAEEVETETYLWIAGEDALEESEWDFAEFKRDKLRAWLMLEDHYAGGCAILLGAILPALFVPALTIPFKRLMRRQRLVRLIRPEEMSRNIRTSEKTTVRSI